MAANSFSSDAYTSSKSEEDVVNVFDHVGNISNPPVPKKVPVRGEAIIKTRRSRGTKLGFFIVLNV